MLKNKKLLTTIVILWLAFIIGIIVDFDIAKSNPYFFITVLLGLSLIILAVYSLYLKYFFKVANLIDNDIDINKLSFDAIKAPKLAYGQYDKLTSLPNRILFNRILIRALNHAKRHNKLLAILVIGIDNFKNLSKQLGKPKSDNLLKVVSSRLISMLRTDDIIARLDNDEFIILLNEISDAKFAGSVAEKILNLSKDTLKLGTQKLHITFSIGISIFPDDGDSLETLLGEAEISLHNAKVADGNRYKYPTTQMNILSREHIELQTALRNAIKNNQLELYFQPQYNLTDATIKRVEALIRWIHPKYGIMHPTQFIPLAIETDLISVIGEWTVNEAFRISKQWQHLGYQPIVMAINVSINQLQKELADIVKHALTAHHLKPEFVEIEITESEIIQDPELTLNELIKIHEMGVKISIDDFGSGYTSINYLRQFPLHTLKIDQSLIKQVENSKKDRAITKSIIELSHSLGLKVIAEGVESIEQVIFLARCHCDYAQGYFFSRPLPEHKLIELLTKSKHSSHSVKTV